MATLDEIMAKATPVERTVSVCVAGQLYGEYEHVCSQLEDALISSQGGGRLSGNSEVTALQRQRDELAEKIGEATFPFTFRALSSQKWSDLVAAHPDPEGTRVFNPETFPEAAIGACCVDPAGLDDDDKRAEFLENISPAQQADLFDAVWTVNTSAPKGMTSSIAFTDLLDSVKN